LPNAGGAAHHQPREQHDRFIRRALLPSGPLHKCATAADPKLIRGEAMVVNCGSTSSESLKPAPIRLLG